MTLKAADTLQKELLQLRKEIAAFEAQCALFQKFVSIARSPDEQELIKTTLRKTIEITTELTEAELGSLFLLDGDGVVTDYIIARGEISPEVGSALIGSVFKKGLAGWVMRQREIGVVEDTHSDERWLVLPDQPYKVRSALAVPIVSGDMLLGILTLMHPTPGHFKPEMAAQMKLTASQVALVLENAYLFSNLKNSYISLGEAKKEIEVYSRALNHELERGHQIQKDFLPTRLPHLPAWEIKSFFRPARHVSGDFYDVFELPGGYIGLVLGDVCDKGVGSALFMALFRSLLRIFSGQAQLSRTPVQAASQKVGGSPNDSCRIHHDPTEALRSVALTNEYIAREHGQMTMFATLFFGVLNPRSGDLHYINGGHEPVFLTGPNGMEQTLQATGPAVGLDADVEFEYKQVRIPPGKVLFAFTDGLSEAVSPAGDLFGKERLVALVSEPAASAAELLARITDQLFDHVADTPLEDDVAMLAIQHQPAA